MDFALIPWYDGQSTFLTVVSHVARNSRLGFKAKAGSTKHNIVYNKNNFLLRDITISYEIFFIYAYQLDIYEIFRNSYARIRTHARIPTTKVTLFMQCINSNFYVLQHIFYVDKILYLCAKISTL